MPDFTRLIRNKDLIAAVVPHTHWDRDWYHPFEQFRLSLCRVIKRLLEVMEGDPRYARFWLDGQTVLLEDYLELYPEDRPRLERLIAEGRIGIGPFYVLPDQYLVTPESLVRNGIIGRRIAESFGGCSRQGYVADPFGLASQLPQIWSKLGLESVFFSRGISRRQLKRAGSTFWFLAPDGESRVLGVFQVNHYSNISLWGVPGGSFPRGDPDTDDIDFAFSERQVQRVLDAYAEAGCRSRVLFFGNGNDHHAPAHRLPDLIEHNARRFARVAFVQVTPDELVDLVKQESPELATLRGEMHSPDLWDVLAGTLDSRPYLKQQYDDAAEWLERRAEPLTALVSALGLSRRAVREQHHVGHAFAIANDSALPAALGPAALDYAWKLLLRCSPHDDICGCSVDATHQDAENRAKRVAEICSMLTSDAALRLAGSVRPPALKESKPVARLLAWNGLGFARTCALRQRVLVPAPSRRLRLVDEEGREIPAAIRARVTAPHYRRWNFDDGWENLPEKAVEADIAFTADLPAMGYRTFFLVPGEAERTYRPAVRRLSRGMANAWVRVTIHPDGTFTLVDKRNGVRYPGLNRVRDQGDAGDLYLSHLLKEGAVSPSRQDGRIRCVEALPDRVTFEVKLTLPRVPVTITAGRTRRSRRTAPLRLRFLYTLYPHSPAVYVRAEWENRHREHRLTVDFPTGLHTARTEAQSAFDVVPHEAPFTQEPCRDFVTAAQDGRRLTVLSRGMHSYDARLERGRLVLTKCLLKANGHIHDGFRPYWEAPGGNCLRPLVQEYAALPGAESDSWAEMAKAADDFRAAPLVDYYCFQPEGDLPAAHSFLEVSGPFQLTAFKRSERGDSLIARLVNLSPRAATATLRASSALKVTGAHLTDLLERRQEELPVRGGKVKVKAKTRAIVTIELCT